MRQEGDIMGMREKLSSIWRCPLKIASLISCMKAPESRVKQKL